ncbi:uncharacterized protein BO95DRAFT_519393 [Aspergillus brunneoviolaceus CBS 621.78]|uniref:Uncharacterized protein n=1 Tax=Aspergillus brunneoviolaceus CBS 621.78 TaxID=1450534 RepID=A0ACD1FRG7_9EURO|nr:hypothetical protein BO95DRAFT_519393 [Aspergillus brunneoviolaceus CBS 621.78]RAH39557.1 hypothetical protein BO95DRAFT_519393 [Aspergillus brunneoviolaceus CBS 621.78]
MPPGPVRRPLAEAPFRPAVMFCLKCLRTSVKNYVAGSGVQFEPNCCFDAVSSVKCRQCAARKSNCIPTATGMLGNASDLAEILRWAAYFWDTEQEGIWDPAFRVPVGNFTAALAAKFADAEKAHRVEHHVSAATKKAMVKHAAAYRGFVVERRTLAARTNEDFEYLRLLPGDAGYLLWQLAISTFLDDIIQEVTRLYADGQGNEERFVQELRDSFPVAVVRGL